mmetsp:Transcript_4480/g.9332  ORF Transcript_4480/g.9332 Transcript_4480/m.9332 type:complete len:362 (+) Transcript_4480:47-1132(+)
MSNLLASTTTSTWRSKSALWKLSTMFQMTTTMTMMMMWLLGASLLVNIVNGQFLEDEAVSCQLVSSAAREIYELEMEGCEAYRSATDNCGAAAMGDTVDCSGCSFVYATSVVAACTDACPFQYGGLTVTRGTSAGQQLLPVPLGNSITYLLPSTFGSYYSFAAGGGKEGTAQLFITPDGGVDGNPCRASFNGQSCPCRLVDDCPNHNNGQQTNSFLYVDCSALPGGAILDTCAAPDTAGVVLEAGKALADYTDLEQLVLVPALACGSATLVGDDENNINVEENDNDADNNDNGDGGEGGTVGGDNNGGDGTVMGDDLDGGGDGNGVGDDGKESGQARSFSFFQSGLMMMIGILWAFCYMDY